MRAEHRLALGLFLSLLAAALLAMGVAVRASALPNQASGKMLAVFDPRLDEQAMFAALVRAGGRPLRRTWLSAVWVVAGDAPGFAGSLRRAARSAPMAGCRSRPSLPAALCRCVDTRGLGATP